MDTREGQVQITFGIMDDYNTETNGISLQDYIAMFGIWMHKFETLKVLDAQGAAPQ